MQKVALVDRTQPSVKEIANQLRSIMDLEVVCFSDLEECIRQLGRSWRNYVAILLDYRSFKSNPEFIRNHFPLVPVMVLLDSGENVKLGLEVLVQGVYAFLWKPLDNLELSTHIRILADRADIFSKILTDLNATLKPNSLVLWLLDRSEQRYRAVFTRGPVSEPYLTGVKIPPAKKGWKKAFEKGEPIFIPDLGTPPAWFSRRTAVLKEGWKSLISIPLVYNKRVMGLIDCFFRLDTTNIGENFNKQVQPFLKVFANQAAQTVRQADLSLRNQQVHQLNRVLGEGLTEKDLLSRLLVKALELVSGKVGLLYLEDPLSGVLNLAACYGIAKTKIPSMWSTGEGLIGKVAKQGWARNDGDLKSSGEEFPSYPEAKSQIGVPLNKGRHSIGVLSILSPHPKAFIEDDVNLLMSLAAQTVFVIDRSQMWLFLHDVSVHAMVQNRRQHAEHVVKAIHKLTRAQVSLWMMSEEKNERGKYLRMVANMSQINPEIVRNGRLPIEPGTSICALALEKKRPIVRQDILIDTKEQPMFFIEETRERGLHSCVVLPLLDQREDPLGVLVMYSQAPDSYGQKELTFFQELALGAVISLQQQRRAEEMRRLNNVARTLMTHMFDQPKELLERVAKDALELTGTENILVYPYDVKTDSFFGEGHNAEVGHFKDQQRYTTKPKPDGLSRFIIDKTGVICHNLSRSDLMFYPSRKVLKKDKELGRLLAKNSWFREEKMMSFVGLPLKSNDILLGVIYFSCKTQRHFSKDHLDLIVNLTHQIADVMLFARLYQDAQRQARELETVDATAQSILQFGARDDLKTFLDNLLEGATKLLSAEGGKVYLATGQGEELRLAASKEIPEIDRDATLKPGEGMAGQVFKSKKPIIIEDYQKWEYRINKRSNLIRTLVEVPFLREGKALGVLSVFNRTSDRKFTLNDLEVLQRLANQASLGIHHMRLLEQSENRYKALETFHRKSLGIIEHLEKDKLLIDIIGKTADLVGGGRGGFGAALIELDEPSETATITYSSNSEFRGKKFPLSLGLLKEVVEKREAKIVNNYPESEFWREDYKGQEDSLRNVVEAPVFKVSGGKVFATLVVTSRYDPFDSDDTKLLERMADLVAALIERAELFDEIKMTRDLQVEAVQSITRTITLTDEFDHVAIQVLKWMLRLMHGASAAFIQLLDKRTSRIVARAYHFRKEKVNNRKFPELESGQGITGWVAKHNKIANIPDVASDERYFQTYEKTRSELAVPLTKDDRVIGVLDVQHESLGAFSPQDEKLMMAIGELVVSAIENSEHYQRLLAISKIGNQLKSAQRSENEIFSVICRRSMALLNTSNVFIALATPEQGQDLVTNLPKTNQSTVNLDFPMVYKNGKRLRGAALKSWKKARFLGGLTEYVIGIRKPFYTGDLRKAYGRHAPERLEGTPAESSWLGVPMSIEKKIYGVIVLTDFNRANAFTSNDRTTLQVIASQAAAAIENSRLYHQMDQRIKARTIELEKALQELKEQQDQLVQTEKMALMGQLLVGVTHEVNNPLAFLKSALGSIKKDLEKVSGMVGRTNSKSKKGDLDLLFARVEKFLEICQDGVNRINGITQSLRSLYHNDSAVYKLTDLDENLKRTIALLRHKDKDRIQVMTRLEKLPKIWCASGQINLAFTNILLNAIQAIDGQGIITIKGYKRGNDVFLEFMDTGVGIPDEEIRHIFYPFFTTKGSQGGSGLGLSITRNIVESHRGEIKVRSQPGVGSKFTIKLPIGNKKIVGKGQLL